MTRAPISPILIALLSLVGASTTAFGQATNLIVRYQAGVPAAPGSAGAANPVTQGWTYGLGVNNIYVAGYDSTNGGWRTVDGSAGAGSYAYYLYALTAADLSTLETTAGV
jgi:hypothetical protein